jgi:16S rRNA (guanine527-N7)-methyltransferase
MKPRDIIITGAEMLGIPVTDAQADAFIRYMDELVKWNRKVNLTAITVPDEIAAKHFLDSLTLIPMLPDGPFRAADIGTGPGFPGIVIKVMRPDMDICLMEPSRKKATFLRHMKRTLGLEGASVVESKAEDMEVPPGGFGVIFSRAFAEPARLLSLAGPLLVPGGRVVLSLGPGWDGILPGGWAVSRSVPLTIPYADHKREILDIRRV